MDLEQRRAQLEEELSAVQREATQVATAGEAATVDAFRAANPKPLEVLFVLHGMSEGSGGGVHSVYQETAGMRRLGVPARIAIAAKAMDRVRASYADADEAFVPYRDETDLGRLASSADVTEMADSPVDLSRADTVAFILRCIAQRTPVSAVRFGEGEGRLLAADPDEPHSVKIAIQKLGRQTGLFFSPAELFKVKDLIDTALDRADVVGLHVSPSFAAEHREWGKRIAEIYAERAVRRRTAAYLAHSLLNQDLRNSLPTILDGQRTISVISCRDIAPALESRFGLQDIAVYQVPSEYVMRDVDDEYEAALHDVPIWPDFYRQLQAAIAVREKGEIFFVGAGPFGKELCVRIKDLGGIALDMGSTLDSMASKVTRGRNRPVFRPRPKTPRIV